MIRISQINIPIFEADQEKALIRRAAKICRCPEDGFRKFRIVKRSVDARDRNDICFSYTVDVKLRDTFTGPDAETERQYLLKLHSRNLKQAETVPIQFPKVSDGQKERRPVIIGAGPCGLFAALAFLKAGLKPVIIERGERAEERRKKTELFFETGKLFTNSNIQFGEGGAGLFSDGKLNTSIKGRENYIRYVLETFVEFGAPADILIDAKPHVGTDILEEIVIRIRKFIEDNGGTYYFNTTFTGFETECRKVSKALFRGAVSELDTGCILLCQGHSAYDTYRMLLKNNVSLEKKAFAMGVRVQHPQKLIDAAMYGEQDLEKKEKILGPASYKLVHECGNGRSVYTFCMCPGGYVINSSSEENGLCINGMSYSDRGSGNANAAVIVNVRPDDFPGDVLSGIRLQKDLERKAYCLLDGLIPYESFSEFETGEKEPGAHSTFEPMFKGLAAPADVSGILPAFMKESIVEGIHSFGQQIRGFNDPRTVVAGIEARTSSPVRILRSENYETSVSGLYAAGEGAGYAGGITSAAVDGIRAALSIIKNSELKEV